MNTPVPSQAELHVPAGWTLDCQGKQDYDGNIVTISTRYWPRGGGFSTYDNETGEWRGNEHRPDLWPSAHAALHLKYRKAEGYDDYVILVEAEFEGETETEVKAQVERWVKSQYDKVAALMYLLFNQTLRAE